MEELWFCERGKVECRIVDKDVQLDTNEQDEVWIESECSIISSGTESLVLKGEVPKSLHERMKIPYMKGEFEFPLTYGYSLVGKVLNGKYKGERVHVMHPHASHAKVQNSSLTILPDNISSKKAVLISNAETVVNAIWDAELKKKSMVVVFGYGIIGKMLSALLMYLGYAVSVSDPAKNVEIVQDGYTLYQGESLAFDVAFHCSGTENGLQNAIESVGLEGTVVELSWYGNRSIKVSLGGSFHYYRKRIVSSQVSHIPRKYEKNWDFKKRKELCLKYIQYGVFDVIKMKEIALRQAPGFFKGLLQGYEKEVTIINYLKYV